MTTKREERIRNEKKLKRIISFCTAAALTATLMLGGTNTNAAADPKAPNKT